MGCGSLVRADRRGFNVQAVTRVEAVASVGDSLWRLVVGSGVLVGSVVSLLGVSAGTRFIPRLVGYIGCVVGDVVMRLDVVYDLIGMVY